MKYKHFLISGLIALLLATINFSPFFSQMWNIVVYQNITFGILLWVFSPLILSFFVYYAVNEDSKKENINE